MLRLALGRRHSPHTPFHVKPCIEGNPAVLITFDRWDSDRWGPHTTGRSPLHRPLERTARHSAYSWTLQAGMLSPVTRVRPPPDERLALIDGTRLTRRFT